MHHSHATPTVTSLPSASYLTWGSVPRNLRDSASAAKRRTPSPASLVPEGGSGETRMDCPVVVEPRIQLAARRPLRKFGEQGVDFVLRDGAYDPSSVRRCQQTRTCRGRDQKGNPLLWPGSGLTQGLRPRWGHGWATVTVTSHQERLEHRDCAEHRPRLGHG